MKLGKVQSKLTRKQQFASITVHKGLVPRLRAAHAKFRPKYTVNGFYEDLLEFYEEFHCPECQTELSPKQCSCKATERM